MKKKLAFIILIFTITSCKSIRSQSIKDNSSATIQNKQIFNLKKNSSYDKEVKQLLNLIRKNASHSIENKELFGFLKNYIKRNISDSFYDIVFIKIDSINSKEQHFYIKSSVLEAEQNHCFIDSECPKPSGYLMISDIPVLIFGTPNFFFNKIRDPKNILETRNKYFLPFEIEGEYIFYCFRKDIIEGQTYENISYKGISSSSEVDKIFNK